MTRIRKIFTAGLAALTLGASIAATATPADAQWRGAGWRGGGFARGGWGHHRGWGGPGPWVAGAIGGLALGAVAAGAYNGYGYGGGYCVANQPVYDDWGQFLGYQRVSVPCS